MNLALAQINPVVGDIAGNTEKILRFVSQAKNAGASLVVFPELAVFGYPPKDLVLRADLVQRNLAAVREIAARCTGISAIVGYVDIDPRGEGKGISNSAAMCVDGRIRASYQKMLLPTYDVFDECRYFNAGRDVCVKEIPTPGGSIRVGLTICEDLWNDRQFEGRRVYGIDPVTRTAEAGAGLLVNLSASPFRAGAQGLRESLFAEQIRKLEVPLAYVNQVGGNDDLVFDGGSMVLDGKGRLVGRAKPFEEDFLLINLDCPESGRIEASPSRIESIRRALVLGLRDYVVKCGFESVLIGLSGGIDSALTAALAVEALGAQRVLGVVMPSRFSSEHSVQDARKLSENLGIRCIGITIETIHRAFEQALDVHYAGTPRGIAEENVQARIRGNLLMALSNKFSRLLLTTGNKSELAVGFCTLYGDMCGGVAVLSDVPKTTVYELSRHINAETGRPLIPLRSIEKPPSAELRENQLDLDTLPPYDVLDAILEQYIERNLSIDDIVAKGIDRSTVERVARMVDANEYKRKQAPVGIKVTSLAFGTGRRMPIAAKYR